MLTELYLHSQGKLPEDKSWNEFHDTLIHEASKESIGLLADANPKDKSKYALFVNVDTKKKMWEVKDYIEIGAVNNWANHLFWQGSGGAQSDKIRNTPHKIYSKKVDFSTDNFITPLETIIKDYCQTQEGKGKEKTAKETGPLFYNKDKQDERKWLENVVFILKNNKEEIDKQVKGNEKDRRKFPSVKPGESAFVGLTIDEKHLAEYELFRRYLLFVKTRAAIQKGADRFKHKVAVDVIKELVGICPSCQREKPLLDQWQSASELSFYQTTNENHLSYAFPDSAFKLCQGCADLLFIFKQHLLEALTRKLGGNECLVLPSIKLIPPDQNGKKRLYENLKRLWGSPAKEVASTEERLLYRLGQLPSYATITFIFGDYITVGKSQNVRRLDELNIVFPDVLPSRLSQISNTIQNNKQLSEMWSLTGRNWQCTWNVQDDFYLLYQLFYPSWEENKKDKSRRRPEVERYLRAIFYGHEITHADIANDCYSNLIFAIKTTRNAQKEDIKAQYARDNYVGNILSLLVFLKQLKETSKLEKEVRGMPEKEKIGFSFIAMPDLGKFVEIHPLLKDSQYLAPFFVGCLFSYAENLQKGNSRLAAYNWLGTMSLTYEDILQDIYPKVLNYITNKEKIVSSPRLQELMKAISYYDKGKCDSNRVALVSFCHGWAVGRDFIYKKKEESKTINQEGGTSNG
ncbi:CRISPR-associated protein [Candidatus Jettenia caeni]|uniref:CRISPR-associated protein n=1 Tax=Candidatus Jettenia caeni TaxID=247490 RepID=I3IHL1_9BACT|nr:CRISPR-associated protein [Candidatus Jettenia caeni]